MSLNAMTQLLGNMMLPAFLGGGKRKFVFLAAKPASADLDQLAAWMVEEKLRAVIDSTFEFSDTPKAFERVKTGRVRGKVVVHVKKS
jgi:NADPH:quinone reductase-like Zn-dependent oxidoreductase